MPKAKIKINLEMNAIYLLRHLLQKDKVFNIPYIIINHMRTAARTTSSSLPFSHLIMKFLKDQGANKRTCDIEAENLITKMHKIGWVRKEDGDGNVLWETSNKAVNSWIKAPGAAPNQYKEPNDPFHIAYKNPTSLNKLSQASSSQPQPQPQTQPKPQPQPQTQPEPIYFYPQFQEHMQYLIQQMGALTSGFQQLENKVDTGFQQLSDRIGRLEEYHQAYDARFTEIGRFHDSLKTNWCTQFNNWDISIENFADETGEGGGNANEGDRDDGNSGEDMEE